jgi:hypothetical protein
MMPFDDLEPALQVAAAQASDPLLVRGAFTLGHLDGLDVDSAGVIGCAPAAWAGRELG